MLFRSATTQLLDTAEAMGFRDLMDNDYLVDKSYLEGYVPSQTDVEVLEAVSGPLPANLCHVLCWYNHIKSYDKEKARLPGVKDTFGKYSLANVEDITGSGATVAKMMMMISLDLMRRRKAKKLREE